MEDERKLSTKALGRVSASGALRCFYGLVYGISINNQDNLQQRVGVIISRLGRGLHEPEHINALGQHLKLLKLQSRAPHTLKTTTARTTKCTQRVLVEVVHYSYLVKN